MVVEKERVSNTLPVPCTESIPNWSSAYGISCLSRVAYTSGFNHYGPPDHDSFTGNLGQHLVYSKHSFHGHLKCSPSKRRNNLQGSSNPGDACVGITYRSRLTWRWSNAIFHTGGNIRVIFVSVCQERITLVWCEPHNIFSSGGLWFFPGMFRKGPCTEFDCACSWTELKKDTLRPCSSLQPHMNHQSGNENLPESSEIDGFEDVGTILKAGELLSLEVADVPSTSCQAHPTADKPDIYNPSKSNGYGNFTISYF